ncbi:MAG: hypothetical protein FJ150_10890 [Euryarchaeota archaeon]|nr:hypothetical protein [Euryarchaeota archaeon]
MIKISEIKIKIPERIPLSFLRRKIHELIREEEIKWTLFDKCKDELLLDKTDLEALENVREKAWQETKKIRFLVSFV